jgi:IstB-like ATP binding protein
MPLERADANRLFQVVNRRYTHGSTIVTSNKSASEWAELFGDEVQHGDRLKPQVPAASQAEQPSAQHAGGEVLLGDRGVASLPALAELLEVGHDHLAQERLHGR